jgi:hypothetical protein
MRFGSERGQSIIMLALQSIRAAKVASGYSAKAGCALPASHWLHLMTA